MATIKTLYQAADGKTFDTEAEADAHDLSLSMADEIAAFNEVFGFRKATAGIAANVIAKWEAYKADATLQTKVQEVRDAHAQAKADAAAAKEAEKAAAKPEGKGKKSKKAEEAAAA